MGLIQLLQEEPGLNVRGSHPVTDKVTRMSRQQGRFEAGRILLPNEAPWLADFENELLAFPDGRYERPGRRPAAVPRLVHRKRAISPPHGVLPTHHRPAGEPLAVAARSVAVRSLTQSELSSRARKAGRADRRALQ